MFNLSKSLTRSIALKLSVFMVLFINVNTVYGSDDYPYGCKIMYKGATRVFTDYLYTDGSSSRHYSLSKYYTIGGEAGEVEVSDKSLHFCNCTVNGATIGSNVAITTINDQLLENYIPLALIVGAIFGVYMIRKNHF